MTPIKLSKYNFNPPSDFKELTDSIKALSSSFGMSGGALEQFKDSINLLQSAAELKEVSKWSGVVEVCAEGMPFPGMDTVVPPGTRWVHENLGMEQDPKTLSLFLFCPNCKGIWKFPRYSVPEHLWGLTAEKKGPHQSPSAKAQQAAEDVIHALTTDGKPQDVIKDWTIEP